MTGQLSPVEMALRGESSSISSVKFLIGESYNHFEMLETLATPYGLSGPRAARADEAAITTSISDYFVKSKIPATALLRPGLWCASLSVP